MILKKYRINYRGCCTLVYKRIKLFKHNIHNKCSLCGIGLEKCRFKTIYFGTARNYTLFDACYSSEIENLKYIPWKIR